VQHLLLLDESSLASSENNYNIHISLRDRMHHIWLKMVVMEFR